MRRKSVFIKAKLMAKQVPKYARRWTIKGTELFAEILADPDDGFAQSLECLGLKNSSSPLEVFRRIQCEFLKDLKSDINELNFWINI